MSDAPARAAQPPPTPTAPTDGAVAALDAVTFRWTAPPGPRAFDLRVAQATAAGTAVVELTGLPSTETTLADALPAGDLLWWVRRGGGPWSAPARFRAGTAADLEVALQPKAADRRHAATRAAAPSDARTTPPPAPVWPHATGEALDGAPEVDWAAVPGFGAPRLADRPTSGEAPRPLGPLGGEIVDAGTVSLLWAAIDGADRYQVELSPHPAFDRDVLRLDAGAATEIGLPGLVPGAGRKLLWRVRALDGTSATPWSRYGRFYPADADTAERFSLAMERALTAQRLRRDHARRVRQAEMDLVPLHERPDAVTSSAMVTTILAMIVSSGIAIALAAVFALVWL